MLRKEFISRTGYEPTPEEYEFIEEAYYESECVTQNQFCQQWLSDYKNGYWQRELELRKSRANIKKVYIDIQHNMEDDIRFWMKLAEERECRIRQLEKDLAGYQ